MSYTLHAGHQICGEQGLPESHVWCSKAYELSAEPWNGKNNILKLISVFWLNLINEEITFLLLSSILRNK